MPPAKVPAKPFPKTLDRRSESRGSNELRPIFPASAPILRAASSVDGGAPPLLLMRAGPKLCLAEPAREARPVPAFPVLWNGAVLRRRSPISRPMQLTNKMVASRPLDPRQQSAHVGKLLMINWA